MAETSGEQKPSSKETGMCEHNNFPESCPICKEQADNKEGGKSLFTAEQAENIKNTFQRAEAAIKAHQGKPEVTKLGELLRAAEGIKQEIDAVSQKEIDNIPEDKLGGLPLTFTREISGGRHDINDICAAIENAVDGLEQTK